MTPQEWLTRAREELDVAQLLVDGGHNDSSVSRAYYAAFYAAKAALDRLGEERSSHSGVISAFGLLVVKEGGADTAAGRALRRLFESRTRADYTLDPVSHSDATAAIERARTVVHAVEAWLAQL